MHEDTTPQTSVELGLMRGAPPPPERLVTADNWIESPYNRWGFLHVRELARTARIPRGDGPVLDLPRDDRDLADVPAGALIHVEPGTPLQSVNHGHEDLVVYAYGTPPESDHAEILDSAV